MKTKLQAALLLIFICADLLPAQIITPTQTSIRREVLGDKVERYYRSKTAADNRPWFFQQVENFFNVVLPPKDQLPFGVSVAFLVGVSEYDYLSPQLPFVKNDLEDMRQFLLNAGGFDTVYVAREKIVNRDLIEDYMRNKFTRGLSKRDRLLFYYAGHGADYGGKTGYMQFAGARSDRFVSTQLLAINEASNWCSEFSIGHLLFVFDCCASGLAFTPRGEADQINALLATLNSNGSRAVIAAGTAGEKTYEVERRDGKGNGVFTRAFLNAAATGLADKGSDGFMTIDEIYARIKDEIARFTVQYGPRLTPKLWALDEAQYRGTFVLVNPEASMRRIIFANEYNQLMNARSRSNEMVSKTIVNKQPPYTLRREPRDNLSNEAVKSMLAEKKIYDAIYNPTAKGIENQYQQLLINNAKVVVDYATGLIWQQNGSTNSMTFGQTPDYIKHLNAVRYAGYSDWCLPTLEETMSLLEPTRKNGSLYIDTAFDTTQQWIWTSDKNSAMLVWYVFFSNGSCYRHDDFSIPYYVRAVRSDLELQEQMAQKASETQSLDFKSPPQYLLRSEAYDNLSAEVVKSMLREKNFYNTAAYWNWKWSNPEGKGLANEFEVQQDAKVVLDRATGLIWQKSGSPQKMSYENAKVYLSQLNKDRFAGLNDWRLPTLEEAMSLMEAKQLNGDFYIDPKFDKTQRAVWTVDTYDTSKVWLVRFDYGECNPFDVNINTSYIRAVHSGWQSKEHRVQSTESLDLNLLHHFPLRNKRRDNLSEADVKAMLRQNNFYCREYDWSKAYSNPQSQGLPNNFVLQQDGKIVFDSVTGLMWQQSGSLEETTYEKAKAYVVQLNKENFADYNDWRLPTLEEAMSLMEPQKNNDGLYINPQFDKTQLWIWTADKYNTSVAWAILFNDGSCFPGIVGIIYHVRAVRSEQ